MHPKSYGIFTLSQEKKVKSEPDMSIKYRKLYKTRIRHSKMMVFSDAER